MWFSFMTAPGPVSLYAQGGRGVRDELTNIFTKLGFGEAKECKPWKLAPHKNMYEITQTSSRRPSPNSTLSLAPARVISQRICNAGRAHEYSHRNGRKGFARELRRTI
jgi:hypothetical protein